MTPQEACNFPLDLENHYGYIYCLTFPNGKKYVGQSIRQWAKRWLGHQNTNKCPALKHALYKYGADNISWELLVYADSREELDQLEIKYIRNLNTLAPRGYNLTEGGSTAIPISILVNNPKLTEKEKNKIKRIRDFNLRMFTYLRDWKDSGFNVVSFITAQNENVCLTTAQYNSRTHMQDLYKDPVKSSELRKKLHEKQKALRSRPIYCEETKETFSCTRAAIEKHTEWNKDKINWCCAKHNKTHLGLHFRYADLSEKEIEEIKAYWERKEYVINSGSYAPRAVYCIETDKIYSSAAQASRELNIERGHISAVCIGKRKTVGGYHFTYAPSEPLTSTPITPSQDVL